MGQDTDNRKSGHAAGDSRIENENMEKQAAGDEYSPAGNLNGDNAADGAEYSYKKFFQDLYRIQKRGLHFEGSTREEFEAFRPEAVKRLKKLLGWDVLASAELELNGGKPVTPDPILLEERHEDGRILRRISIRTLPGVRMPFWLLIPDGSDGETGTAAAGSAAEEAGTAQLSAPQQRSSRHSGVQSGTVLSGAAQPDPAKLSAHPGNSRFRTMLCLPAHGSNKDVVAGVESCPEVSEKLKATPKEAYGREFCRQGYAAVCPDLSGFGERQEHTPLEDQGFSKGTIRSNPLGSSCARLSQTAEALGVSLAGLESYDLKKLLDYIVTLPYIDADRIGCAGFSGGGLNTMWIAALDERIRTAVISGYIHGYYNSILETHLCACNFVPDLWREADIPDIASLIAPRPLYVENGLQDHESGPMGIADPTEQVAKIRRVYSLFGAERLVEQAAPEGPHAWYGTCYDFVSRNL